MYTIFITDRRLGLFLLPFLTLIVLALIPLAEPLGPVGTPLKWVMMSSSLAILGLMVLAGWPGYWSPWRVIFRKWPILNKSVYPDLNGVWRGKLKSNWPIIDAQRTAALGDGHIDPNQLRGINLDEHDIEMEIHADLWKIAIRTIIPKGNSQTLVARADKSREGDHYYYSLYYVYRQTTEYPEPTDETTHVGAALLRIELHPECSLTGEYWTTRKWREGLNTAGQLTLTRVSDKHK